MSLRCTATFFPLVQAVSGLFYLLFFSSTNLERGSSAVARRTRNERSPGSNPPLLPFRSFGIFVIFLTPQLLSCINEYLAINRQWWKCERLVVASVKRFERSNGLDAALYKNIPFLFLINNFHNFGEQKFYLKSHVQVLRCLHIMLYKLYIVCEYINYNNAHSQLQSGQLNWWPGLRPKSPHMHWSK